MIPSAGKDSDGSDSRKTLILFLTCSVDSFGFFSPSIVVVNFIDTKKTG